MSEKNRYGLSREIPPEVELQVRIRCGFGCVVCGCLPCQCHHFNPPFKDARYHDPNGITLLCDKHHGEVNRGLLSNSQVEEYNTYPICQRRKYSSYNLNIGRESPEIVFGTLVFNNTPNAIQCGNRQIIGINPPKIVGDPFKIDALFQNKSGKEIARIVGNEWRGSLDNWDIKTQGSVFTIRQAPRLIDLKMKVDPPRRLLIENYDMLYNDWRIIRRRDGYTEFRHPNASIYMRDVKINNCRGGIMLR